MILFYIIDYSYMEVLMVLSYIILYKSIDEVDLAPLPANGILYFGFFVLLLPVSCSCLSLEHMVETMLHLCMLP